VRFEGGVRAEEECRQAEKMRKLRLVEEARKEIEDQLLELSGLEGEEPLMQVFKCPKNEDEASALAYLLQKGEEAHSASELEVCSTARSRE